MSTFIERSDTVKDIVSEIADIDRICDQLRLIKEPPIIKIDGVDRQCYTLYNSIEICLTRYREILMETKIDKGDDK